MTTLTQGEKTWAWLFNIAKEGPPYSLRYEPACTFVSLEIRIGKTIKFRTPRQVLSKHMPNVPLFPSPRVLQVKIYAQVEKYFKNRGRFVVWVRVPWPYEWVYRKNTHYVKLSGTYRLQPKPLNARVQKAYAAFRTKSEKHRKPTFGQFSQGLDRPNPTVKYGNVLVAIESTSQPYLVTGVRTYETFRRSFSSVNTPGFRLKKGRNLPINGYSSSVVKIQNGQGWSLSDDRLTPRGWSYTWDGTAEMWPAALPVSSPSYDVRTFNKAVQKLIEKAELEIAGNIAQDFAQAGQTVKLIGESATKIVRSLRMLRRGQLPQALDALLVGRKNADRIRRKCRLAKTKTLADNWLELQYGWKPLLQDIDGALRSTAAYMQKNSFERWATVSSKLTVNGIAGIDIELDGSRIGYRKTVTDYATRLGARFGVANSLKSYLAQTGFTNPLNLGWEILPFSFVVDWFLPVGPWLTQLSSWDGLVFIDGFRTDFLWEHCFVEIYQQNKTFPPFNAVYYSKGGLWARETIKTDRVKLTSFPHQHFPSFKNPMSVTHAVNALALLASTFASWQE